ncbi:KipI antagonist [Geobacillus subterraneus]|uniref:KipI antagonist n=2 Tax=Geobacillus TaxID=129337 RepID=A0ABM6ABW8_9BACL|nr:MULTISPECIES: biotin-dependent carboxyltransferase family protein [Geobacillus]AMX83796.1 KipI antagonist [Geobacillus subterraneus]KZS26909.1 KipI antagonist [Geobacillus subterraneus]OXB88008.1 KipI antagonist [Geobacillus uzenensis]
MIDVMDGGFFTTVQDGGRSGYRHAGVPVGGAMDAWAYRLANALVGNEGDEAVLEATMAGPTLRFHVETVIAVCGGDFPCTLNGRPLPLWKPAIVRPGDVLKIGVCRAGWRAYIAVAGGIAVPPVMGSRSTYVPARLGGLSGRPLQPGDVLPTGAACRHRVAKPLRWGLARSASRYIGGKTKTVRAVPGPEYGEFTPESRRQFFAARYEVTPQSDRIGYRLFGPALALGREREMVSEAVVFGTVQVPASGQPIVLMADSQTTGGYPRIAQVAAADLPVLAQARPGDCVQFQPIAPEEAARLYIEQQQRLGRWVATIRRQWGENSEND